MAILLKCLEKQKIQNGDSEKRAKLERFASNCREASVKLWARMNLFRRKSREEKLNKGRALGMVTR